MDSILVVDDDSDLRSTIVEVLEQEGFSPRSAGSADRALEMAAQCPFSLVLLDMVMPGIDGMSAIPLIKKILPRTRIIIMTAFSTVPNAVQAMKQGADDYIAKPFKIDALLTLVRKNLQEARFLTNGQTLELDGVFHVLANLLRRRILLFLKQNGKIRFMDLVRFLEVEDHTKVNFHLRVLRDSGFIDQDEDKCYLLSPAGRKATESLSFLAQIMGHGSPSL